ncbi:MAG: RNA 2'-phosphotransferase [Chloroflexota bacterium]|nr:RNA 2'-phosphotransferase [Chloroflexota bacterium]
MPRGRRFRQLSKFLSLLLRHRPDRFGLPLDPQGWAKLDEVMEIIHSLPNLSWAAREDVLSIIREDTGDGKRRFELSEDGSLIRATYGHSLDQKLKYRPIKSPPLLYHGTAPRALFSIRKDGLRPMGCEYVYLSADVETAIQVGRCRTNAPVLIAIQAAEAWAAGVEFYRTTEAVYLSQPIPPEFLEQFQSR